MVEAFLIDFLITVRYFLLPETEPVIFNIAQFILQNKRTAAHQMIAADERI